MKTRINSYSIPTVCLSLLLMYSTACEDFIKIDPPITDLVKQTVFENDETAEAAMLDIYYQLRLSGFASGTENSVSYLCAIYSDEEINYFTAIDGYQPFNDNELLPNNPVVLKLWGDIYKCIYKANSIIEALPGSTVSEPVKIQLEGEAKFIRAICYFYLVNLWGDVPLVTSTDFRINSAIGRTKVNAVYQQVINDLQDAKNSLSEDYAFSQNLRVRANKGAATALLARVYLYTDEWENAEEQATLVINNTSQYNLAANLAEVFRGEGQEAIFQLWSDFSPSDRPRFNVPSTGPTYGSLRPEFANSFEAGDQRWVVWGRSRVVNGTTYYYTLKYLSFTLPPLDFTTVMRLAEQFLIRAEARTHLNNVGGAQADLNVIRHRAGLGDTPAADQASLLAAVAQERKAEFFNEWGHRWFDLKRTDKADQILSPIRPQWLPTDIVLPIPEYEIKNNTALTNAQNPGY